MEEGDPNDIYESTARNFRTTFDDDDDALSNASAKDRDLGHERKPLLHVVSLRYPPDSITNSKIKYLRRYRSFIHEAEVVCRDSDSSAKDIYDSVVPRECEVQFLRIHYDVDTTVSTAKLASLVDVVSSIHINIPIIREDDVFRTISAVCDAKDFGVRLSGWHDFKSEYIELVRQTSSTSGQTSTANNFFYEVKTSDLLFWVQEAY